MLHWHSVGACYLDGKGLTGAAAGLICRHNLNTVAAYVVPAMGEGKTLSGWVEGDELG